MSRPPQIAPRYVGGNPGLDFVNTVDWTPRGLEQEQIVEYGDLLRWAQGAGVVSAPLAKALAAHAQAAPAEGELALASARHTRWVLKQLLSSVAAGRLEERALASFNEVLNDSGRRLMVAGTSGQPGSGLQWQWRGIDTNCESPLWPVVWAAANLLASAEASLIKECGGSDCGWLFVDRSRNRLRRWCQMSTCGTREKTRRRNAHASA